MNFKLLWLERDVVEAGIVQAFLADRTVVVCPEPERDTILAELVTANSQNSEGEVLSADDTKPLVTILGIHFLEMENCNTSALWRSWFKTRKSDTRNCTDVDSLRDDHSVHVRLMLASEGQKLGEGLPLSGRERT